MTANNQNTPVHNRDADVLIYREQLDDYTPLTKDECNCIERGCSVTPSILTPRPDKGDTIELRCGDCGAMYTDLYWSNMDGVTDERDPEHRSP